MGIMGVTNCKQMPLSSCNVPNMIGILAIKTEIAKERGKTSYLMLVCPPDISKENLS